MEMGPGQAEVADTCPMRPCEAQNKENKSSAGVSSTPSPALVIPVALGRSLGLGFLEGTTWAPSCHDAGPCSFTEERPFFSFIPIRRAGLLSKLLTGLGSGGGYSSHASEGYVSGMGEARRGYEYLLARTIISRLVIQTRRVTR